MNLKIFPLSFILFFCTIIINPSVAKTTDPILGNRTINLINHCPFPVWFGFISAAMLNKNKGSNCQSDSDCYAGATCVDRGLGGKACFWKNPIPQDGQFQLLANGGRNTVQIPIYQNGLNYAWSGAVAGRTNCANGKCETADCNAGSNGCAPGAGFLPPVTQAEFTFNNNQRDYNDVEVVNGMNIPVEISPNLTAQQHSLIKSKENADPYYCGNPGGMNPLTETGSCSWKISPPSNDYKWVTKGGVNCSIDSDCQDTAICGLSFDPQKKPQLQKTCGKLLGYWSADQICGQDKNFGPPFNCAQTLPPPQQNLTMFNMYGCAPIDSCYKEGAQSNCCGCANWNEVKMPDSSKINVPASTTRCSNINSFWVANVQNKLAWMKQACPTTYTYPFDDPSSTFACDNMQQANMNTLGYTITFCPGGQTGGVVN